MEINDDIQSIKFSLLNERMAPELLPFNTEAFEDLKACLDYQTESVEQKKVEKFQMHLFELEIERIRFYLAEYLRTRLRKIQMHAAYVLKEQDNKLTSSEIQFAAAYVNNLRRCFQKSAMYDVPKRFNEISISKPNLMKNVVAKALVHIGKLEISEKGQTVNISKGDVYILKYIYVRDFIQQNKMRLL